MRFPNSNGDFFFPQVTMFKKIKLFRTSSTQRREEESILKRRRMIQHALLSSYRLVPGVAGGKGCISFECFSKPRFFLCHRDHNLIIERYKDSEEYSKYILVTATAHHRQSVFTSCNRFPIIKPT